MNKDSYNIPLSFKVNQSLLSQIETFCQAESITYSSMFRAGISVLLAKRHRSNTGMTNNFGASW